jgi:hypothetical protein
MLSLDELKATVMEQADKAKQLASERAEQKSKVCAIIRKNLETIVVPYVLEMNNFLKAVRDKAVGSPKFGELSINIPLGEDIDKNYTLCLRTSNYGVHIDYTNNGMGYFSYHIVNKNSCENKIYPYQYEFNLRNVFLTEDKALALVDVIKDQYVTVLTAWAAYLKDSNEQYAKAIEDLKNILSASHAVETKEDGTVEIMLGGKKYVGHIAEE